MFFCLNQANKMEFSFIVLFSSTFFLVQTGVDGLNIPELFTTIGSTVYIPCYVDTGNDHEQVTPTSWTRVAVDGYVQTLVAPNFESPSNVASRESQINSFDSLVVTSIEKSWSGTYTCHTDKGSASTLVHVLDGESPPIESTPCSEGFELVHGRCLYYSNKKKNWEYAHLDCFYRTSSLITFKDTKDLQSFQLNLQKSGPTHYQFPMWTGHAYFEENNSRFGALNNDAQFSPMLCRYSIVAKHSSCGRLTTVHEGGIFPTTDCDSVLYNFLCEQPTL